MIVYRITDCKYINDLSGVGAALYGGRWNSKDTHVVYTAQSGALALLEAVVHIGKVPANGYCMATINIPDDSISSFPLSQLPEDWAGNPPPDYLRVIGDHFINAGKYLVLKIPSVLMMEEHNYLLNPRHPEFKKVKIISQRPVRVDGRLFTM
jgi:RES domain-containing protein